MPLTTVESIFLSIVIFLAFITFISQITPPEYKIMNPFDFVWLTGGIVAVAGACVIWSGLPCAGALAVFTLGSVLNYLLLQSSVVKLLVFTPLSVLLIYVVSRLARGGG